MPTERSGVSAAMKETMRLFKKQTVNNFSFISMLFSTVVKVLFVCFGGLPLVVVFTYSHMMSTPVFIILALLAFSIIPIFGVAVYRPIFLRKRRALMGDEEFFKKHPLEYRKELYRWRKVSAHMNGTDGCEPEALPGLLQMRHDLTTEEAAKLGVAFISPASGQTVQDYEFNCLKYDRIYYGKHKLRLRFELFLLRVKRWIIENILKKDMPVSPYEHRLKELGNEFLA